jgi:hypothetical protein
MHHHRRLVPTAVPLLAVLLATVGCGAETTAPPAANAPSAAAQALRLAADPGTAVGVAAAKAAGPAAKVVVSGRIASTVPGHFVLRLVDTSLPFCGETNPEDKCKTPWDYCCEPPTKLAEHTLLVEARSGGKPVATPALPDLRLLDLVKVTGEMTKDEHGNHVLVATGVFRQERPKVADDLRWPQ